MLAKPAAHVRNVIVPLQNGGVATFPVPMTPADHTLLTTILNELGNVHVIAGERSLTNGSTV